MTEADSNKVEVESNPNAVKYNKIMGILSSMKEEDFNELIEEYSPKSNCKKCYGRGYTGIVFKTKNLVVCKCVRNKVILSSGEDV